MARHSITSVDALLRDSRHLRLLARELGRACLDNQQDIRAVMSRSSVRALVERVIDGVDAVPEKWWRDPRRARSGFAELLDDTTLARDLRILRTYGAVAHLALLKGLCSAPLARYYAETRDLVELERGDVIPPTNRPTHTAIRPTTPRASTMRLGHLLYATGFDLYPGTTNLPVRVVLDFTERADLDRATWLGDRNGGRFPVIATVHPWGRSDDLEVAELDGDPPTRFFAVRPRTWEGEGVLRQLRAVRDAGIAVLPELCLPAPQALMEAIEADPGSYPRVIVCGSAHASTPNGDGSLIRVNESLVLIDGRPLIRQRKVHPFTTRWLEAERELPVPAVEWLTTDDPVIQIAAGSMTRLAVAICADLNDVELPDILATVGVNMLLAPALTPSAGAFTGAIGKLASRNQGVSVIVNGTPIVPPGGPQNGVPLVWAGVPRPSADEQTGEYSRDGAARRVVGRLDVNRPLAGAMEWIDGDEKKG